MQSSPANHRYTLGSVSSRFKEKFYFQLHTPATPKKTSAERTKNNPKSYEKAKYSAKSK